MNKRNLIGVFTILIILIFFNSAVYANGGGPGPSPGGCGGFYEDFENNNLDNWNLVISANSLSMTGQQSVISGNLNGTGNYIMEMDVPNDGTNVNDYGFTLFKDNLDKTNYELEFDSRIDYIGECCGYAYIDWIFNSQSTTDFENSYWVHMAKVQDKIWLFRRVNGVNTEIAEVPYSIDSNIVYHTRLETDNGIIKMYVNNQLVIDTYDDTFTSGTFGFGTSTAGLEHVKSSFDNIEFKYCTDNQTEVCTDSDGGLNYYIKGTVCSSGTCYTDYCQCDTEYCQSGEFILEYECLDNWVHGQGYACPNGCEDGACLSEPINETNITCTDTDGGRNYYEKGTACSGDKCDTDYCQDSEHLAEMDCGWAGGIPTQDGCGHSGLGGCQYKCPYGCSDGICLSESSDCSGYYDSPTCYDDTNCHWTECGCFAKNEECPTPPPICKDSDNGKDYYTKGTAVYYESMGSYIVGEDKCSTDTTLLEYYCDGEIGTEYYTCPYGCSDGICLTGEVNESEITPVEETIPVEEVKIIPTERSVAVRATKALTVLEEVKSTTPEQATGIKTAQDKILEVNTKAGKFEQEINERGIGYKFRWFFGMVAEQEKEDAEFLRSQGQRLTETSDLLLEISEQVEEPAKTVLIEQSESLKQQAQEMFDKAENKEDNAKGLFGWFGFR